MSADSRKALLVALLAAALGAGCGTPTVRFTVTARARTDVGSVRRVAIVPFECADPALAPSARGAGDAMLARLAATGAFEIVERQRMEEILREQAMQLEGMVDDQTAVRVGRLLGVDAMVCGSVTGGYAESVTRVPRKIQVDTGQRRTETFEFNGQTYQREVPITREEIVYDDFVTIQANVTFHARLVGIESARVLATRQVPGTYNERVPAARRGSLPGQHQILASLVEEGIDSFVQEIAPHAVERRRYFPKVKGDSGAMAVPYAQRQQWADALRLFEAARAERPEDPAAWNAVGVCQEALHHPQRAREAYQRAYELSQDARYLDNATGLDEIAARPE